MAQTVSTLPVKAGIQKLSFAVYLSLLGSFASLVAYLGMNCHHLAPH
ncbi:MAG: hypothetical protein ABI347_03645 [Nitrososphaera sp.]|jgi:hypothetical protein